MTAGLAAAATLAALQCGGRDASRDVPGDAAADQSSPDATTDGPGFWPEASTDAADSGRETIDAPWEADAPSALDGGDAADGADASPCGQLSGFAAGFIECDGACVNRSSDPLNCGGCGYPCANDEQCGAFVDDAGPEPSLNGACACPSCGMTTTLVKPAYVAEPGSNIVVTAGASGSILYYPYNGGTFNGIGFTAIGSSFPQLLFSAMSLCDDGAYCPTTALRLAADSTNVYAGGSIVYKVDRATGTGTMLAFAHRVVGLAVDASNVYFSDAGDAMLGVPEAIYSVPIAGGATTTVTTDTSLGEVAVVGDRLFWIAQSALRSMSKEGGAAATIAPGHELYAFGGTVYFADQTHIGAFDTVSGAIRSIVSAELPPTSLYADAANVFWTEEWSRVRGAPVGGGAARTYSEADHPYAVVADSQSVYWYAGSLPGGIYTTTR